MKNLYLVFIVMLLLFSCGIGNSKRQFDLTKIPSPILLKGNDSVAYRDPAVLFCNDRFYLF